MTKCVKHGTIHLMAKVIGTPFCIPMGTSLHKKNGVPLTHIEASELKVPLFQNVGKKWGTFNYPIIADGAVYCIASDFSSVRNPQGAALKD